MFMTVIRLCSMDIYVGYQRFFNEMSLLLILPPLAQKLFPVGDYRARRGCADVSLGKHGRLLYARQRNQG